MPTTSEIVLAAIGILATLAFALLLAPSFVWVRRRMTGRGEQDRGAKTEGTLDPKAIANELAGRAVATIDDEAPEPAVAISKSEVRGSPSPV